MSGGRGGSGGGGQADSSKTHSDQQVRTPGAAAAKDAAVNPVETPAIEQPENLPNLPEAEAATVSVRHGMFGVHGTGDTSGYSGLVRKVQLPPASERPYGGWFDQVADALGRAVRAGGYPFSAAVEAVVVDRGELTFHVRRERLLMVAQSLRDDPALRFEPCLRRLRGALPGSGRPRAARRLPPALDNAQPPCAARGVGADADPHLPSLFSVYPTNDWHERETYDFFGIIFDGHPALTRIQMPDDWPGHPQRKDYPLGGIPVEYKGAQIAPPDERRAYS